MKPGFDYHLATVHRVVRYPGGGTSGYFAHCDACDWRGETRPTAQAADEDAYSHDVTHNETGGAA